MTNLKNEIMRINTMINKDRADVNDTFTELMQSDMNKIIFEYFEVTKEPKISIDKQGNTLFVSVNFEASAIKNFRNIKQ